MGDSVFLWIASHFTGDMVLVTIQIQALLWSVADICAVFAFLNIASLARARTGKRRMVLRYLLLWGTALLTVPLLWTETFFAYYLLDCVIVGIHILIAVYTFISEGKDMTILLKDAVNHAARESKSA